ncbi:MAG: hypothetical protein MI784_13155 [Cytophagales bacterium]|nr:hypothetical protein [Cytophagales bacterium]
MRNEGAYIDKYGKLKAFSKDDHLVDLELSKDILRYAYEQVCWNFSCLKSDPESYYYHTEEFCFHDLCMVTLQLSIDKHTLNKIMIRTPDVIMVYQEVLDDLSFEINELIDDAKREYILYKKLKNE